jgi:hypothetical protein
MRLARELAENRLGDVVVAAPIRRALGEPELVEVARAVRRVRAGARAHRGGIVDEIAGAVERLDGADLRRCGARRHDRGEAQAELAREPRLGDRGAAGGRVDDGLALAQAAVAERVQVERTREAMLEAAGRMRGLVLEVDVDAGKARQVDLQEVRVGGARGLALECVDRLVHPVAPDAGLRSSHAARSVASSAAVQRARKSK